MVRGYCKHPFHPNNHPKVKGKRFKLIFDIKLGCFICNICVMDKWESLFGIDIRKYELNKYYGQMGEMKPKGD